MRLAFSAMLLSTSVLVAVAAKANKDEPEGLKGNWSAVSIKAGGQDAPEELVKNYKFRFDDKTYTNIVNGEVVEDGAYTFDDTKDPKTIDFDIKKGPDEGKKQLAIYKIEGKTLTLVASQAGSAVRPKSFKPAADDAQLELVMERAKP
jgi:uncharacterized protein (TIGR03067 family)